MSDNLKRLNFKSKLISVDGRTYKFPEEQDIIIIDAPCSSTGTIRKSVEHQQSRKKSHESITTAAVLSFQRRCGAAFKIRIDMQ